MDPAAGERSLGADGTLFDRVPVGLLRVTPEGRILEANAALVQMLGYPDRATLVTRNVGELYVDPAHHRRHVAGLDRHGDAVEHELHWRRFDGREIWLRALVRAIRDERGAVVYWEGSLEDVTERRWLAHVGQIQSAALEATANGVVITDREGRIEWVNPAFTTMTGYAFAEVVSRSPQLLKSGQHGPSFYLDLWATILSGRVWHGEMVNRRKDGTLYTEEMTITPVRNAEGVIEHFVAVKRDVSERERAQETLRKSEEYYRALIEHALDIIVVINADGRYRYASPSVEAVLGYTPAELLGTDAFDLVHPDDVAKVQALFAEGRRLPGTVAGAQYRVRHRDRSWRVLEAIGRNLLDHPAVAGVVVNARDVTARQQTERALVESERRYRLVAENASDVIWVRDLDLNLTYVSPSAARLHGFSVEEIMAQPATDAVTPESLAAALQQLREVLELEGQMSPFESRTLDLEMKRKDGSSVWVESKVSVLRDEHGRPTGLLGVSRDVTERRQAAANERRLQGQLAQSEKLAAMGELLAGVAHELNNPLSVVLGYASVVRQMAKGGAIADRVDKIRVAAERCARIVRNFLMLARQHPPARERVDLNQLIRETLEILAYPLRVDNVEVVLDLADGLPELWADPHQLQQVMTNLVTNAHQAMRGVTEPRRLTLKSGVEPAAGVVTLEATDTGPGIPADVERRLFEPFFTTKPVGQGTGLGLSICKGIVESHGGTVQVEGRPGRGARFLICLPAGGPAPAAAPVPSAAAPRGDRRAVLVIDDEPDVARMVADTLAIDGYRVVTATSGREALARIDESAFDVILTDVKMPGLDGPTLYREVTRRRPELASRFVFFTGDVLNPATLHFLEESRAAYLPKPFSREDALALLRRVATFGEASDPDGPGGG